MNYFGDRILLSEMGLMYWDVFFGDKQVHRYAQVNLYANPPFSYNYPCSSLFPLVGRLSEEDDYVLL